MSRFRHKPEAALVLVSETALLLVPTLPSVEQSRKPHCNPTRKPHVVKAHVQVQAQVGHVGNRLPLCLGVGVGAAEEGGPSPAGD
jgi:hypothetical protein